MIYLRFLAGDIRLELIFKINQIYYLLFLTCEYHLFFKSYSLHLAVNRCHFQWIIKSKGCYTLHFFNPRVVTAGGGGRQGSKIVANFCNNLQYILHLFFQK